LNQKHAYILNQVIAGMFSCKRVCASVSDGSVSEPVRFWFRT